MHVDQKFIAHFRIELLDRLPVLAFNKPINLLAFFQLCSIVWTDLIPDWDKKFDCDLDVFVDNIRKKAISDILSHIFCSYLLFSAFTSCYRPEGYYFYI